MKKYPQLTLIILIATIMTLFSACNSQAPTFEAKKVDITYGVYKEADGDGTITLSEGDTISFKDCDTDAFTESAFAVLKEEMEAIGVDEESVKERFSQPYDFYSGWDEDENGEDIALISFHFAGKGLIGIGLPYDPEEKIITFLETPFYYTEAKEE